MLQIVLLKLVQQPPTIKLKRGERSIRRRVGVDYVHSRFSIQLYFKTLEPQLRSQDKLRTQQPRRKKSQIPINLENPQIFIVLINLVIPERKKKDLKGGVFK